MDDELLAAEAGEALLLGILPLFTSALDQDNSVKSSYFENFCTLFSAEAQLLETWLIEQDAKIDKTSKFYLEILDNILALFDSLVSNNIPASSNSYIRGSKYTRLPILRHRIESADRAGSSIPGLRGLLYFGHGQSDYRKILHVLTTYNNKLSGVEENLPTWWSQENLHKRRPAYEVRQSAATLFQALLDKWPPCEKISHEALLCLSRYNNGEESKVEFDLLFSTHNPRWQESTITVLVQQNEIEPSQVRFADPVDPPPIKRALPKQLAKDMCILIENTSKRKSSLLMILDGESKLWYTMAPTPPRKTLALPLCDSISMSSIIEKLQEERLRGSDGSSILTLKQRRVIAVILAHSILQFCGTTWLCENWDKSSISFFRHAGGDRLVLSAGLQTRDMVPDTDAPYRFHQYPGVLALAILLLEMELKKTLEMAKSEQDDPAAEDGEFDLNADLEIAQNMCEEIQDNTSPDFKAAVEACLRFQYFKDDTEIDDLIYHRDKLYDDMGLRRKIYSEIVAPLERELCISFPDVKLDDLREMPISFTFWERMNLAPPILSTTREIIQMSGKTDFMIPPFVQTRPIQSLPTKYSSPTYAQTQQIQPIFFHDVPLSLDNDSREASKKWFKDYTDALDGLIDRVDYSPLMDASRIKIAVLDTGIDWEDSFIRGTRERLKGWKNWADDRKELDERKQVHDASGHGTHVAALLLKTSPESDVYLGRVAGANGSMIEPEKIAEAIRYATDVWNVDIITMSFGFRKRIGVIDQAIKYAFSKDVVMFSAAANDGGNEDIAFPALAHEMVIGINSTNAWGDKSNFTPNTLTRSENFSILGEAVESSWPKHLGQGIRRWRSGTSYATPIAAGTAATMLFYARMKLQRQELVTELRTCAGMRKLLLSMAENRDGYNYLRPWLLWRKDDEKIIAHIITALG